MSWRIWLWSALGCPAFAASLTITAAGDVRITPRLIRDHAAEISQIHLHGDLVFANFEGVLAESPDPDPWKFSMPRSTPDVLSKIGITALTLANNHSLDLGPEAYRRTESTLRSRFAVTGSVVPVNGTNVRLIGFSFGSANDVNDLTAIPRKIRHRPGEILIVSAHMGGESRGSYRIPFALEWFDNEKRGDVVEFSHRSIDAGADLVLGHSPHVPRGIELYKGKLIVYSLGNFVFDYPGAVRNAHAPGYTITTTLNDRGDFQSGRIDSYDLQGGVPVPDATGKAYRLIRFLTTDNLHATNLDFPGAGRIERCKR